MSIKLNFIEKSIVLIVFVLSGIFGSAQTRYSAVSGVVTTGGMPVENVTVQLKGTTRGAVTDKNGRFQLRDLPAVSSYVLNVSSVGYTTQEVAVTSEFVEIELAASDESMGEVVVIGYGSTRKSDITTAATNVPDMQTVKSRPVSNVNDFLQGAVPGVTVLQQGGDPSRNASIVIRGTGSLANETPLTVVDGAPYYGPPINPNDIQAVSILKDASAAAIYGAQAASGVIVITTKKGKQGKPVVTVDLLGGLQQAANLPTPLTAKQQSEVYNLAADNAQKYNPDVKRLAAHDPAQNPWGQINRTNWIDAIFRTAKFYNANVGISGARENINYYTSFGYQKKEGLLVGTDFERYSVRIKSNMNITSKLTIGENISYVRTNAKGANTSSSYSGTIVNAMYMPSAAPVYDSLGRFHGTAPFYLQNFAGAYGDVYNPVALLLAPTRDNPTNYIDASAYGKYEILPGLSFKSTFTYGYTSIMNKEFVPRRPELGRTNLQNFLYETHAGLKRWIWENQLEYIKTFAGVHNLNLTVVQSAQSTDYNSVSMEGRNFNNEEPFNQFLSNAGEQRPILTSVWQDRLTSTIGRAMYNYQNRYYLSGSIRRDESSRLYKSNQADFFPSFSAGWNVSNESFFTKNKVIDNIKIRASWGRIGNINSVSYYSFDAPLAIQYAILGAAATESYKGVYAKRESTRDLLWEKSQSFNVGADASFADNKIDFTVDYFVKKTIDMILTPLQDLHKGLDAPDKNVGTVSNKGVELTIGYRDRAGDFDYSMRGNFSYIHNNLDNMNGYSLTGIDYIEHSNQNVRDQLKPYRSSVGQPLYSYYLIPYLGIFKSEEEVKAYSKDGKLIQPNAHAGDFKFQDTNGDGVINDKDRVYMGSYQPKITYAFNGNIHYKNFDLGLFLQGAAGGKIFNGYKYTGYNASQSGYNLDSRVLNAWSSSNPNAEIPILSTKDNNKNFGTTSSWYLESGNYLRIKNITLGYTFYKGARLFIGGENLLTLTKYSGLDPEVGGIGLDVAQYPVARVYTLGLNFSF